MNNQKENLKGLLSKFFSREQAEQTFDDIQKGEQILSDHPAPEPEDTLIADIKEDVSRALMQQKAYSFRRKFYETTAVAAAVIIVITGSLRLFEKGSNIGNKKESYSPAVISAVWESESLAEDDAELAMLRAEIEQTAQEVSAVQLNETYGNGYSNIVDLEMELIEIDSDFWKG